MKQTNIRQHKATSATELNSIKTTHSITSHSVGPKKMKIQSLFAHHRNLFMELHDKTVSQRSPEEPNQLGDRKQTKWLHTARPLFVRPPENPRRHSWFSRTLLFDDFSRPNASVSVNSREKMQKTSENGPKKSREEELCSQISLNTLTQC